MKLVNSFNHAINGIVQAFKLEKNLKIHFIVAVAVIIAAVLTHVTRFELIALVLCIAFVIFAEMVNTAVEAVCNMLSNQYNEFIRIAKNVSAGAVLVAAGASVVVGYLVFYRKIYSFSLVSLDYLSNMPVHITVAALVVLLFAVILIKSFYIKKRGSYVQGGMPSGHTAFAFALFAAIALTSADIVPSIFAAVIAVIVAESRMETKVHTLTEVLMGALLGVAITIIVFKLSELFVF